MNFDPKVVPFDRSAAYMYHRAMKNRRDNNHIDALELLRRAVERSPENLEYRLDLAEMYSEMGCHEQSNRLLLDMLSRGDAPDACYYGLAMNMLAMNDLDGAKRALVHYRSREAAGDHFGDARELADEMQIYEAMVRPLNRRVYRAMRAADLACERMKDEDFADAARLFAHSLRLDPGRSEMRALYGMDLMLMGRREQALSETRRALEGGGEEEESSVRALCVAAQTYQMAEMAPLARETILRAVAMRPDGLERRMLLYALGEMQMHEEVAECARMALTEAPHDRQLLHIRAVALLKTGAQTDQVEKFWARILRIDPEDSVAQYYQAAAAAQTLDAQKLSYVYQVPREESFERLKYVSDTLNAHMHDIDQIWRGDARFRTLLKWCANVDSAQFQRAAVTVLAALDDEEAEGTLRAMLAGQSTPYALKVHAAALLKMRGADMRKVLPPGVDERDGLLPDSEMLLSNVPVAIRQAARFADDVLEREYRVSALVPVALILIRAYARYPEIARSRERINPMAAAAAYCYLEHREAKPKFLRLSRQFGCSVRRLVYYAARFAGAIEEEASDGETD